MTDPISLGPDALELLTALADAPGFDIYSRSQAVAGRELEHHGLVRIVPAQKPPVSWAQQPYFGIEIEPLGQDFIRTWLASS